jgi:hypothetical protein
MPEALGAITMLLVVVAVFWLVRRYAPPETCPRCGGTDLLFLGESMRECNGCGRIWIQ